LFLEHSVYKHNWLQFRFAAKAAASDQQMSKIIRKFQAQKLATTLNVTDIAHQGAAPIPPAYVRCPHSLRSMVYVTVGCPSVRLSVCPLDRQQQRRSSNSLSVLAEFLVMLILSFVLSDILSSLPRCCLLNETAWSSWCHCHPKTPSSLPSRSQ